LERKEKYGGSGGAGVSPALAPPLQASALIPIPKILVGEGKMEVWKKGKAGRNEVEGREREEGGREGGSEEGNGV
jgi:hypothetical protein